MENLRLEVEEEMENQSSSMKDDINLNIKIEELDLTVRSFNCLKSGN